MDLEKRHYINQLPLILSSKSGDCYRQFFTKLQKCCEKFYFTFEDKLCVVVREMNLKDVIKPSGFE